METEIAKIAKNDNELPELAIDNEDWLRQDSGRTAVFQAWLDSLESKTIKRIKVQVDGTRPHQDMRTGAR